MTQEVMKRYNNGKPRFDLITPEAMFALAEHFRKGAEKYLDRQWEIGGPYCSVFASLQRHAWAWMNGEDIDEETGSHHMTAVAWNALALLTFYQREIGTDDRPSKAEKAFNVEVPAAAKYNPVKVSTQIPTID